jgi:hypothetical protein
MLILESEPRRAQLVQFLANIADHTQHLGFGIDQRCSDDGQSE